MKIQKTNKNLININTFFYSAWISKPIRVFLILICILILIIIYASTVKLGYMPASESKSIMVHIEYQGAFENEIERTITNPIEREISKIQGIKEIFSVSEQGKARINIIFFPDTDLNKAYLRVREAVDYVHSSLPQGVGRAIIIKSDINSKPIFIAAFDKSDDLKEDDLKRIFENVEGAGEIEIGGGFKKEIIIEYDPEQAISRNLSVSAIIQGIRSNNIIGGFGKETETPSVLDGRLFSLEDFEQLHLNRNIVISDIAKVSLADAERMSIGTVNGEEKVIVYINKAGDSNTVLLCQELTSLVTDTLNGKIIYNYGEKIESALGEIFNLVLAGILLVIVLTLIFLRKFYPAMLVSLNIPFSILFTVACLNMFGFELNLMTLSGIAIGVGLVIDTGIVFIEVFLEQYSKGLNNKNLFTVIKESINFTRTPIIFSSLTTIAVFLPLIFAEQELINQFSALAVSVVCSIIASIFFVFLFIPTFLTSFYRKYKIKQKKKEKSNVNSNVKSYKILKKIFFFISKLKYLFTCLILILLISAFISFTSLSQESFRTDPGNSVSLTLEYKSGSNLSYVFETASRLETLILSKDDVITCGSKYEKERASFDITLNDGSDRELFIKTIRQEEAKYNDIFFYFPVSSQNEADFSVILTGKGNNELRELASRLSNEIKELQYVTNIIFHFKEILPSKLITVNLENTKRLGVDPYNIYSNLYWALSKPVASKWNPPGEEADIKVFADNSFISTIEDIMHLKIMNNENTPLELSVISNVTDMEETGRIYHHNRQRSVSFSVITSYENKTETLNTVREILSNFIFPEGYRGEAGLEEKEENRIQNSAAVSLIISILLILIILIFQFESIKIPLLILLQIPLSFILPVLFLFIFNKPVSLPVMIGLILTAGISVNNSILVFDKIKNKLINAFSVFIGLKAKIKAMTIASLTTVLGVFPLIFSGESSILSELSITMAAGITGSIIFLILSLPAFTARK